MGNIDWERLKKFISERTGNSEAQVELMSVIEILDMCVSGASVLDICDSLELDVKFVSEILKKYLGFTGWEESLKINPLALYKSCNMEYNRFIDAYKKFTNKHNALYIELLFNLCKHYSELESELETYD